MAMASLVLPLLKHLNKDSTGEDAERAVRTYWIKFKLVRSGRAEELAIILPLMPNSFAKGKTALVPTTEALRLELPSWHPQSCAHVLVIDCYANQAAFAELYAADAVQSGTKCFTSRVHPTRSKGAELLCPAVIEFMADVHEAGWKEGKSEAVEYFGLAAETRYHNGVQQRTSSGYDSRRTPRAQSLQPIQGGGVTRRIQLSTSNLTTYGMFHPHILGSTVLRVRFIANIRVGHIRLQTKTTHNLNLTVHSRSTQPHTGPRFTTKPAMAAAFPITASVPPFDSDFGSVFPPSYDSNSPGSAPTCRYPGCYRPVIMDERTRELIEYCGLTHMRFVFVPAGAGRILVLNVDVGYPELIFSAVFPCVLHVTTALATFMAITAGPPANGGQHSNNHCGANLLALLAVDREGCCQTEHGIICSSLVRYLSNDGTGEEAEGRAMSPVPRILLRLCQEQEARRLRPRRPSEIADLNSCGRCGRYDGTRRSAREHTWPWVSSLSEGAEPPYTPGIRLIAEGARGEGVSEAVKDMSSMTRVAIQFLPFIDNARGFY
ncbi:hypothetical protein BC826DRAFT_1131010 [Russula brevipes]|nr:hypothetical protein BC826DRAFT_1131010 [Russula brevipes]